MTCHDWTRESIALFKRLWAEMGLPPRNRAVVARPAARVRRGLPCSIQRAASPLRPRAATISGVFSAVERPSASSRVENLPEAVAETPPPRVFLGTECVAEAEWMKNRLAMRAHG